jgi:hypothetical protein
MVEDEKRTQKAIDDMKKMCFDRLSRLYYWPKLHQQVLDYCRTCPTCQANKADRQLSEPQPQELTLLNVSDLSPLASYSMMESLRIGDPSITDISVVASMPLLEEFAC